jgi:hypothetical protein
MTDELSIYNAALSHLGEERQLDDLAPAVPSREQRVLQALLPLIRDSMLRKHPWLCAERRLTVTREPLTGDADWAFSHLFLLPPEMLRLWSVDPDRAFRPEFERSYQVGQELTWQVGSHAVRAADGAVTSRRTVLFANAEGPLRIRIIERVAYEHLDALLSDAMGYELAARAAGPLQADKALAKSLKGDAREALAMAVTAETSEFVDDVVIPRGRFLSSR